MEGVFSLALSSDILLKVDATASIAHLAIEKVCDQYTPDRTL